MSSSHDKLAPIVDNFELPACIEAERSILGAIMLDNGLLDGIGLTAFDFALSTHQVIFARMVLMREAKRGIDIVTLAEDLRNSKNLTDIGGVSYLASLMEGLPRGLPIKGWMAIVKEKALLRQIITACNTAITKASDQQLASAEIVEQLGKDLKGIKKK